MARVARFLPRASGCFAGTLAAGIGWTRGVLDEANLLGTLTGQRQ
jgi:hypothetical protein